jgi:sugar phosphate permease
VIKCDYLQENTIRFLAFTTSKEGSGVAIRRRKSSVLTIALCSGLIYGINTLLMTSIPLRFQAVGKESTVAGFLDFAAYMGAGLTGVLTGSLLEYWGWPEIMIMWGIICALGAVMMVINHFEDVLVVAGREGVSVE